MFNLNHGHKHFKLLALSGALLLTTGCATHTGNAADPFEPWNRGVYQFNDALDRVAFKPAGIFYREVMPEPAKKGVNNFFGNLSDFSSAANNSLQGKFSHAASDISRFVFNSTFGLFGLFDVASDLEKGNEDFGQTLGYWGVGSGPYLVLPLLGPSSIRDAAGFVVDSQTTSLTGRIDDVPLRNTLLGVKVVNTRANLLEKEEVLNEAALDRYAFIRDSYLQYRQNQVYDGNPPIEFDDELDSDADAGSYLPAIKMVDAEQKAEADILVSHINRNDWVGIDNFNGHDEFHHRALDKKPKL